MSTPQSEFEAWCALPLSPGSQAPTGAIARKYANADTPPNNRLDTQFPLFGVLTLVQESGHERPGFSKSAPTTEQECVLRSFETPQQPVSSCTDLPIGDPVTLEESVISETGPMMPEAQQGGRPVCNAYDLALYWEPDRRKRGVLKVTLLLRFYFRYGKGWLRLDNKKQILEYMKSGGQMEMPEWLEEEKVDFANGFVAACLETWNNKYRIVTHDSIDDAPRDIGVQVRIRALLAGLDRHHWELTVDKAPFDVKTLVYSYPGVSCTADREAGRGWLDDYDLIPQWLPWAGQCQRVAVHEFGHLLGLRDEYPGANHPTSGDWTADEGSVMNGGETVKPRHYAFFAHWLTTRIRGASGRNTLRYVVIGAEAERDANKKMTIEWDTSNSGL